MRRLHGLNSLQESPFRGSIEHPCIGEADRDRPFTENTCETESAEPRTSRTSDYMPYALPPCLDEYHFHRAPRINTADVRQAK